MNILEVVSILLLAVHLVEGYRQRKLERQLVKLLTDKLTDQ